MYQLGCSSTPTPLISGVSKASVHRLFFTMYVSPLYSIIATCDATHFSLTNSLQLEMLATLGNASCLHHTEVFTQYL